MYNWLLRAIPMKVKNSFVIYDFSLPSTTSGFVCENLVRMADFPDALSCLENGYQTSPTILSDVQKKLSSNG